MGEKSEDNSIAVVKRLERVMEQERGRGRAKGREREREREKREERERRKEKREKERKRERERSRTRRHIDIDKDSDREDIATGTEKMNKINTFRVDVIYHNIVWCSAQRFGPRFHCLYRFSQSRIDLLSQLIRRPYVI